MARTEGSRSGPGWLFTTVLFFVLFAGGMYGGYHYFSSKIFHYPAEKETVLSDVAEDYVFMSVFYPVQGRLQMEERRVKRTETVLERAEAAVGEFLKGPAGSTVSVLPKNIRILGVSFGIDGVLYVDLSGEFRMHFMGDAMIEYMTLRGLYESLMFNLTDISDVKVLVEGREVDTLGGHLSLRRPIGRNITKMVSRGVMPYEGATKEPVLGLSAAPVTPAPHAANLPGGTGPSAGNADDISREDLRSPLDEEVVTEELVERDVEGPLDER